MIIDLILDRKDNEACGYTEGVLPNGQVVSLAYNPDTFYRELMRYNTVFKGIACGICEAMDYGEEEDVRRELCRYIMENEYNPAICDYINSRNWISA